ncbi:MAG: hypothetical protein ACTS22_01010 [Phycisphaerales bacterium]
MDTLFGYDDLADQPAQKPAPRLKTPGDRESCIRRIIELNPSATAEFLAQFSAEQLALYLEHLLSAQSPRGRQSVWSRPGDTPAIMLRRSAA